MAPIGAIPCVFALFAAGCEHREPPTWDPGEGSLSAQPLPAPPPSPDAGADGGASATDAAEAAAVDPGTLAQTRDRPHATGEAYDARAHALWDAIVADDPDRALPAFFPVAAYKQVKAIQTPELDWKRRLVAAYARDIHKLHERLGRATGATFVELEVPGERARWVEPGEEGNKLGYWRVYGTKLRYQVGDTAGSFDVSSLISWRGEWYVVHLTGFK